MNLSGFTIPIVLTVLAAVVLCRKAAQKTAQKTDDEDYYYSDEDYSAAGADDADVPTLKPAVGDSEKQLNNVFLNMSGRMNVASRGKAGQLKPHLNMVDLSEVFGSEQDKKRGDGELHVEDLGGAY